MKLLSLSLAVFFLISCGRDDGGSNNNRNDSDANIGPAGIWSITSGGKGIVLELRDGLYLSTTYTKVDDQFIQFQITTGTYVNDDKTFTLTRTYATCVVDELETVYQYKRIDNGMLFKKDNFYVSLKTSEKFNEMIPETAYEEICLNE